MNCHKCIWSTGFYLIAIEEKEIFFRDCLNYDSPLFGVGMGENFWSPFVDFTARPACPSLAEEIVEVGCER